MSIHLLIIDVFNEPVALEGFDLHHYLGYVKDLGGKPIGGGSNINFELVHGLDRVHMRYIVVKDPEHTNDDLTIVFRGNIEEQRTGNQRIVQNCIRAVFDALHLHQMGFKTDKNGQGKDGSFAIRFCGVAGYLDGVVTERLRQHLASV